MITKKQVDRDLRDRRGCRASRYGFRASRFYRDGAKHAKKRSVELFALFVPSRAERAPRVRK
jgi:hypothetical protein